MMLANRIHRFGGVEVIGYEEKSSSRFDCAGEAKTSAVVSKSATSILQK